MHRAQGSIPGPHNPGLVVVRNRTLRAQEAEEHQEVQGYVLIKLCIIPSYALVKKFRVIPSYVLVPS